MVTVVVGLIAFIVGILFAELLANKVVASLDSTEKRIVAAIETKLAKIK